MSELPKTREYEEHGRYFIHGAGVRDYADAMRDELLARVAELEERILRLKDEVGDEWARAEQAIGRIAELELDKDRRTSDPIDRLLTDFAWARERKQSNIPAESITGDSEK